MRLFAKSKYDKEIEQARSLMTPPETYADGFNWKTIVGAFFLGFIMMPGSMYLALVVGNAGSMTSAAQWVTIILFAEVARRSLKDLKMQEVYILYYMAGLSVASPFQGLLWNQYFIQSPYAQAMGVAQEIPSWVAPSAEAIRAAGRTFFTKGWLIPVAYVSMALVIQRLDEFGLGYALYRITNDVEELPYPMAPVGASGITALVQTDDRKEPWRWRCFSIGGMIGMAYGLIYVVLPSVTGTFLVKPLMLIPIPFIDFTQAFGEFLPAAPLNLTVDLGLILTGMVLPFWVIIGGAIGSYLPLIVNPILYEQGVLSNWRPGMDVIDTVFVNNVDFYLSFGIGLTVSITVVSMAKLIKPLMQVFRPYRGARELTPKELGQKKPSAWRRLLINDPKRGDFSIFISLAIYVFTSTFWISLSAWLIEGFPWKFFVFYAVFYTPVIAYACAKLEGMAGQTLAIPLVREATYILSGYRGVKIWFAPAPLPTYGNVTSHFRVLELTGTKIKSVIKTQILVIPIIIVASFLFSQLLWRMAEVPSAAYPFAQKMWDLQAKNTCLTYSSTMEGGSLFYQAWRTDYFLYGLLGGTGAFFIFAMFGLPSLMIFGLVRGFGHGTPAVVTFELIGALLGRYYFMRRFGDMWRKYAPILLAGYACGMGLVAMVGMSFAIVKRMMDPLIF